MTLFFGTTFFNSQMLKYLINDVNEAWYTSSFVTFFTITQGLVNTIHLSLIHWSL